jgi:hypothetical protein
MVVFDDNGGRVVRVMDSLDYFFSMFRNCVMRNGTESFQRENNILLTDAGSNENVVRKSENIKLITNYSPDHDIFIVDLVGTFETLKAGHILLEPKSCNQNNAILPFGWVHKTCKMLLHLQLPVTVNM